MARQAVSSGSEGSSGAEFPFRKKQADHEQRTRQRAVHDGKVAMWIAVVASVLGLLCSAYGIISFRSDDSFFCPAFIITAVGWGLLIGIELFLLRELHEKRQVHHGAIIRRSAFIFGGWCFGYFAAALVVVVVSMIKGKFAHSDSPSVGYAVLVAEAFLDLVICGACLARYVHRYLHPMRQAQPHLEDKANMESTEKQIARKVSGASSRVARKVSSRLSGKDRRWKRSSRQSQTSDRRTTRPRSSLTKKKDDYGSASGSESSASRGSASSQPSSEDELLPPQRKATSAAPKYPSSTPKRQSAQPASTGYPPSTRPARSSNQTQLSAPPPLSRSSSVPLSAVTSTPHTVFVADQTRGGTEVRGWDVDTQRYKPGTSDARAKYLPYVASFPPSLRPGYSPTAAPPSGSSPLVRANGSSTFPPLPPAPSHPYGQHWRQAPNPATSLGTATLPTSSSETRPPDTASPVGPPSSAPQQYRLRAFDAHSTSQRPVSLQQPPTQVQYRAWHPSFASNGSGSPANPDALLPMPLYSPHNSP